jgi:hypothetical protein
LKERYKRSVGDVVRLEGEDEEKMRSHVYAYITAKSEAKHFEEVKKTDEGYLKDFIKERAGIAGDGWSATCRSDSTGRPNWKKIAYELGATTELIKKHTGEPSRRFLVKVEKGGQ